MARTNISRVLDKLVRDSENLDKDQIKQFTIDELIEKFHDGLFSVGTRKNIFEELAKQNIDLAREQITNLCRIYEFSASRDTKSFIYFLLDYGTLDLFMKIECVHTLNQVNSIDAADYYFKILDEFIITKDRPSITLYIDILRYVLILNINQNIKKHIEWTIIDSGLSYEYIYKCIISIQKDDERVVHKNTLNYFYTRYFELCKEPKFKILCAQYLLQNKLFQSQVQNDLLFICNDAKQEYNIRADSADTLVRLGNEEIVSKAREIIKCLGKDNKNLVSVYSNRQNVHDENIDNSVKKFLLELGSIKLEQKNGNININLEDVMTDVNKYVEQKYPNKIDQINSSLLRIKIDQIIYPGSQTLQTIFVKIYTMIIKHEMKELLLQRLIEELIDMHETCSSGHCSRLVNVFSGIDGFNMNIGFRKQIQGNVISRLTKLIKNVENEELRDKIMEEMVEETILLDKPNFSVFFKKHIINIHDELSREYVDKNYLGQDDFELYFRQAITFFETGQGV